MAHYRKINIDGEEWEYVISIAKTVYIRNKKKKMLIEAVGLGNIVRIPDDDGWGYYNRIEITPHNIEKFIRYNYPKQ